jgi:hypothetical protein
MLSIATRDATDGGDNRPPLGSFEAEQVKTYRVCRARERDVALPPGPLPRRRLEADEDRHVFPPIGPDQIPRCGALIPSGCYAISVLVPLR